MSNERRFRYLDILKGIGIIFMIMGHIGFGGKFDRYIHSFHMPLFFCVSGYLYKDKGEIPTCKLLLSKVRKILIPYVFFFGVNYLFWILFKSEEENLYAPLIRFITYNTSNMPMGSAIWFLTAIFWVEVFYILIDRFFPDTYIKHLFIFVISAGVSFFQTICDITLPLTIDIAFVCIGFYHIGHIFREKETCIKNSKVIKILFSNNVKSCFVVIALLFFNSVITFLTPYVNVKMRWYGIVPVFWINALLGIAAYYLVSIRIDCIRGRAEFISKCFAIIGKDSIVYLGFNQLIIFGINILLGFSNSPDNIGSSILELVLVIGILYSISKILNSKSIKFLIGR